MPLKKTATPAGISKNIAEFHTGKTYAHTAEKFGKATADRQAVAAALATARKVKGRAMGGPLMNPAAMIGMPPAGMQMSPAGIAPMGVAGQMMPPAPTNPMMRPLLARGGTPHRAFGGMNMAKGPSLNPSWAEKQEARGMMHTGPIMSTVPGRTDNHHMFVPSGSYVLPAQHIASMGQGNSMAGMSLAHSIFGPGGPYGSSSMRVAHGRGAPRVAAPHLMKLANGGTSEGGARGEDHGEPVEVMLSGGEYVIAPSVVRKIGHGNLKNGHSILDAYVMATRKKEIATQKKLPPPAKK
jgi:hypothetical protein